MLRECAAEGVDPGVAAELALVARFYERIGDHAVALARQAATMSGGGAIAAPQRVVPH
jgi:phosphate uptake regulator